jgi:CheY-like chemotaxis protein
LKTILIVDDEPDICEILAFDFHAQGLNVLLADNATAAIEILKNQSIDVVVSDVRMPHGDGFSLLENFKDSRAKSAELILITGFSSLTLDEAYNQGAAGLFSKPFDRKSILKAVRRLLLSPEERWGLIPEGFKPVAHLDWEFADLKEARSGRNLQFGVGGFCARFDEILHTGQEVAFRFRCETMETEIEGGGIVRWIKSVEKKAPLAGVEFVYFNENCISEYSKFLGCERPKSFIPNGTAL